MQLHSDYGNHRFTSQETSYDSTEFWQWYFTFETSIWTLSIVSCLRRKFKHILGTGLAPILREMWGGGGGGGPTKLGTIP
jgi:hypothetical protein